MPEFSVYKEGASMNHFHARLPQRPTKWNKNAPLFSGHPVLFVGQSLILQGGSLRETAVFYLILQVIFKNHTQYFFDLFFQITPCQLKIFTGEILKNPPSCVI